jgi:inner membrane transporter RhtA
VTLAALVLMAWRRPWHRPVPRALWAALAGYGAILGIMNVLIYQAFAHIPIGIAVGVEVMGPLAIVLAASRRPRDFLWLACAVSGLALLLPIPGSGRANARSARAAARRRCGRVLGQLYRCRAAGGCGAGHRCRGLGHGRGRRDRGAATARADRHTVAASPQALGMGLAIAVLSSALPYGLEIEAMRRLPASLFGMLLSAAPAVAALTGWVLLGERLTPDQCLAIGLIVLACAGTAATSAGRRRVRPLLPAARNRDRTWARGWTSRAPWPPPR